MSCDPAPGAVWRVVLTSVCMHDRAVPCLLLTSRCYVPSSPFEGQVTWDCLLLFPGSTCPVEQPVLHQYDKKL
jgi:hypothetical protein